MSRARTELPRRVLCVHCEVDANCLDRATERKGCPTYESLPVPSVQAILLAYDLGRLCGSEAIRTLTPTAFWELLTQLRNQCGVTWIVGQSIYRQLEQLGLPAQLKAGRFRPVFWQHDAKATVIECRGPAGHFMAVDLANYSGGRLSGRAAAVPDAAAAVLIWGKICAFARQHGLPGIRGTLSSMAWASWRQRPESRTVRGHKNAVARKLERSSYYAGRVDCHTVGTVPGVIVVLDVNSLYPYCAHEWPLPTSLIGLEWPSAGALVDMLDSGLGAIAHVEIDSDSSLYPVRWNGNVHFANGRFRTVLPGPELHVAMRRKHVRSVGLCATYRMGRPLASYIEDWYALRLRYRDIGSELEESLCKGFLNSLIGRFGKRSREWRPCPSVLPRVYMGAWTRVDTRTHGIDTYRWLGGSVEALIATDTARHCLTALSAYVNSYGRLHMQSLKKRVKKGVIFYEDTDALHTDPGGSRELAGAARSDRRPLGGIRESARFSVAHYSGPRSYLLGEGADGKRAGIAWRRFDAATQSQTPHVAISPRYVGRVEPDGTIREITL